MPEARYGSWVYLLLAVPVAAAVLVRLLAPEPHGHWVEHLSSAALKGAVLVVLLVLVAMLGWRSLPIMLLASSAVVMVGIVCQVRGDNQVAQSIWGTYGDPGFGQGYAEGHDLSAFGDLLVMGGGLAFAVIAGATRWVSAWLAVAAAVMVVIPPPFFWPAAGILLVLLRVLTAEPVRALR